MVALHLLTPREYLIRTVLERATRLNTLPTHELVDETACHVLGGAVQRYYLTVSDRGLERLLNEVARRYVEAHV